MNSMHLTTPLRILAIFFLGSWPARADLDGPKSAWPSGTVATGSTTHPALSDGTQFYSSYAIDGDTLSKWNDDTQYVLPDVLTIETLKPVTLAGIILLSAMDGWVLDYTVETSNGSSWALEATVTKCDSPLRYIPFASPVIATQLRITVTGEQDGGYTRIHEVYPIFAEDTSNTSESNSTPSSDARPSSPTQTLIVSYDSSGPAQTLTVSYASSSPAQTLTISDDSSHSDRPTTSPKSSNTGAIVGGVLGGVFLMLSFAIAALLAFMCFKKRKERTSPYSSPLDQPIPEGLVLPVQLSSPRYSIYGRQPNEKRELETTSTIAELGSRG